MTRISIGTKISAGFVAALVVLLISVASSYRSTTELVGTTHWVNHTHRVIETLDDMLSDMKDVQSGARAFVLTGQESLLDPFRSGVEDYPAQVRKLRGLTSDNLQQQRLLDEVEPMLASRVQRSRQLVDLRRKGDVQAATGMIASGAGQRLMNELQEKIDEMQQAEHRLLDVRSREVTESAGTAIHRAVLLCALAFLMVGAAGLFIHRDIAGRRQAVEALSSSEARLGLIVETIADGIFILNPEGRIVFANSRAESMFGLNRKVMAGRTHDDTAWKLTTIDGKPFPVENLPFAQAMQKKAPVLDVELAVERADGSRMCLSVNAAPMIQPDGSITGVVASACDMTRRREVELMKEQFVSTVSHELRTPLASLRGFTELMLSREYPREKQHKFLTIIHDEAIRLTKLINDFLDLQRMESGHQTYDFEPLDPRGLLEKTLTLFDASKGNNRLRLDVRDRLPKIWADPDRLRQVLSNLLSNAIKYSPDGGEVVLGARQEGQECVIWVSDQGIGIPRAARADLFKKFFRVDDELTRNIGGTGLGLALVKEIVVAHEGRVWVESELGMGSSFFFAIPVCAEPPSILPARKPAGEAAPDILLVEDDRAFAHLLAERFHVEGLRVEIATSGEEALQAARLQLPAMGIVDIQLDGLMDGWQLIVHMKDDPKLRPVPLLIISASDEINARGLALAGADYVLKPVSPRWLLETVKHYLPSTENKRVLVVDDDALFRKQVVECLASEQGIEVLEAADGQEGLAAIERARPDLLLLDLLMPGVDGFEVLRHLRGDHRAANLPVLVITAKQLQPEDRAYIRGRMAGLVRKHDVSLDQIVRTVTSLLPVAGRWQPSRSADTGS